MIAHHCLLRFAIVATALLMLGACGPSPISTVDAAAPPIESLVTAGWLAQHLGASNVSARKLTDENGRYESNNELATLFDGDRDGRAITYCGGGIAASANAFAMTRLGYKDVAVYTASLQEWAADPENPLETE